MRLYTRTGDTGETGLLGQARVSKDDPRIEAVGTLDELNASLGLAATAAGDAWVRGTLEAVQRDIFAIGARLADVRPESGDRTQGRVAGLAEDAVQALEQLIDRAQSELPPLTRFILPGGTEAAVRLHLARSVCRRAERRVVALAAAPPAILAYLNRLSDLLFALARLVNHRAGVGEQVW